MEEQHEDPVDSVSSTSSKFAISDSAIMKLDWLKSLVIACALLLLSKFIIHAIVLLVKDWWLKKLTHKGGVE